MIKPNSCKKRTGDRQTEKKEKRGRETGVERREKTEQRRFGKLTVSKTKTQ